MWAHSVSLIIRIVLTPKCLSCYIRPQFCVSHSLVLHHLLRRPSPPQSGAGDQTAHPERAWRHAPNPWPQLGAAHPITVYSVHRRKCVNKPSQLIHMRGWWLHYQRCDLNSIHKGKNTRKRYNLEIVIFISDVLDLSLQSFRAAFRKWRGENECRKCFVHVKA